MTSPRVEMDVVDGIRVLAKHLRRWREFAALQSVTARYQGADGVLEVTCDDENRIWIEGDERRDRMQVDA